MILRVIPERDVKFSDGLLYCGHCKQFLPLDKFYKSNDKQNVNYGYRFYCKDCEKLRRDKNKIKLYYKNRNYKLKEYFINLMGGCCQRCGYKEFQSGLDFHHIDRRNKKFKTSHLIYKNGNNSILIENELDKCCLLCRNCHNSFEAKEWQCEFTKRNGLGWTIKK